MADRSGESERMLHLTVKIPYYGREDRGPEIAQSVKNQIELAVCEDVRVKIRKNVER